MSAGGTFIDDGDAGEWAKALRFAPWIADERDGTTFRNLPAMAFKRLLDAAQGDGQRLPAFTRDVLSSLHDTPNSPEAQHNHD